MYLLDTNACIGHLTGRTPKVTEKLRERAPSEILLCSVVKAELLYGARKSAKHEKNLARLAEFFEPLVSLPFDDAAAQHYGRLRAALENSGTPIGPNDLMIAAIALAYSMTLVTANEAEFGRVSALTLESWQ